MSGINMSKELYLPADDSISSVGVRSIHNGERNPLYCSTCCARSLKPSLIGCEESKKSDVHSPPTGAEVVCKTVRC